MALNISTKFLQKSYGLLRPRLGTQFFCNSPVNLNSTSPRTFNTSSVNLSKTVFPSIANKSSGISTVVSNRGISGNIKINETQTVIDEEAELSKNKETIDKINELISSEKTGRLFTVILMRGKQHKITTDDLMMVICDIGAPVGERIVLEKVMVVGSKDFTLMGRPLLPQGVVRVEATVLEKTLSRTKISQYFKKRKNYRKIKFKRAPWTLLRINDISFSSLVGENPKDDCL